MEEEWKVVEGYEGKYEVSDLGNVRNAWDNVSVAQVLNGLPQYYYINFTHPDGWRKMERVHRIVALAFIENDNPPSKNVVDHKDRNKTNNHHTNLRWVTHKENMRNKEGALMIDGMYLKDFVEGYDNPSAAYTYIAINALKLGSIDLAVQKYESYLSYGQRRLEVVWNGKTINLNHLCEELGLEYGSVSSILRSGWDIWNAVYNILPTSSYYFSFEIKGDGVDHWYPTKDYFRLMHGRSTETLTKLLELDYTLEEVLAYTGLEYLKHTVQGVTGTLTELCAYFEVSESAVQTNMTRKGMSLEEALTSPRQRVKKLSINGVYNSPKYWYENFGINAKRANGYKANNGKTFRETLEHFGIDTSEMIISLL
jgi:hypothetical protein